MLNNNKDYYDLSAKERYALDEKKYREYADSVIRPYLDRFNSYKKQLIILPIVESIGIISFGYVAYSVRSIVLGCLVAGLAGISLVSAKRLYPCFKANNEQIRKIKEKRDDIVREFMQMECNQGKYDDDNVVSFKKKIRK